MYINKNQSSKTGFTLIEMIIAIGIGIIISTLLMLIVVNGLKHVRNAQQKERLQADALFLTNKFAYWIRQGKGIDEDSSSEFKLVIILLDGSHKIFEKQGDEITLRDCEECDGKSLMGGQVIVTDLIFTYMEHSVKVSFELKVKDETLLVNTTLAQRNSL